MLLVSTVEACAHLKHLLLHKMEGKGWESSDWIAAKASGSARSVIGDALRDVSYADDHQQVLHPSTRGKSSRPPRVLSTLINAQGILAALPH